MWRAERPRPSPTSTVLAARSRSTHRVSASPSAGLMETVRTSCLMGGPAAAAIEPFANKRSMTDLTRSDAAWIPSCVPSLRLAARVDRSRCPTGCRSAAGRPSFRRVSPGGRPHVNYKHASRRSGRPSGRRASPCRSRGRTAATACYGAARKERPGNPASEACDDRGSVPQQLAPAEPRTCTAAPPPAGERRSEVSRNHQPAAIRVHGGEGSWYEPPCDRAVAAGLASEAAMFERPRPAVRGPPSRGGAGARKPSSLCARRLSGESLLVA